MPLLHFCDQIACFADFNLHKSKKETQIVVGFFHLGFLGVFFRANSLGYAILYAQEVLTHFIN